MKRGQSQTQQRDIQCFFKKKSSQMQAVQSSADQSQSSTRQGQHVSKHGTASTGYSLPEGTSEGYNSRHLPAATGKN